MTSTESQSLLRLALETIQNDPQKAAPLIKLLYAFKNSKPDANGEMVMDEVIGQLYLLTNHYQESIKEFASLAA